MNFVCMHVSSFKSEEFNKSLDVKTNRNNLFKILVEKQGQGPPQR